MPGRPPSPNRKRTMFMWAAPKTREEFVEMREARDAKLGMPKLIIPSIQVNMRAGRMPPAEGNGRVYLKVPVNGL